MNISHEQLNKILEEMVQNKLNHIEYTVDKILNLLEDRERGQESRKATKNTKKGAKTLYRGGVPNLHHQTIAKQMYEIINATTKTRKPNLHQWANDIRKLNEIDGAGIYEIIRVFKVANKDDFWSMNVRSPKKLRKHWERLTLLRRKSLGLNQKTDDREPLDYYREKNWK